MPHRISPVARLLLIAALPALAPCPAGADPVEDFYRGRTMQLVIGFSAGAGYDLYGRVLARHMSKHIPGRPAIVVQNMPGAGSLKAANYLFSVAPKDGSTIGMPARGMAMEPLVGDAKYDGTKFGWIGSITSENSLCASWHTSPIKTANDALTRTFTVGGSGHGADPDVFSYLWRNLLDARIKVVTGYPGGNEINLAMERGEVEGRCGWSWSSIKSNKPAWLKDGKINLLVQFALEKSPDLPGPPLIMDLAKSDEQRQILRLILSRQVMARPFLAPPDIPEDRKAALRKAFDATMTDPEFLAEAEKTNLEVNPVTGPQIDTLLAEVYRTPKDVIAKAVRAIGE
jgi:tripartite-type tricarboxylate transporter receptor subunit TctC